MSCDGTAIGWPLAGLRMLLLESISTAASICASGLSGMWTAIWSPSKSALNAVQTNDFFENVPNHRLLPFNHLARLLDGRSMALLLELVVDKWLEELERHLLRQTALVQLQLRTDNNH